MPIQVDWDQYKHRVHRNSKNYGLITLSSCYSVITYYNTQYRVPRLDRLSMKTIKQEQKNVKTNPLIFVGS